MDSFYDAPRRAPMPTQIEKFVTAPVVPEVSIIGSSKASTNKFSSYNSWRAQQNRPQNASILSSNGENVMRGTQRFCDGRFPNPQNTSQFLKKQVRFESPVLQQRPSLGYEPFTRRTQPQNSDNVMTNKPFHNCEKSNPPQQNNLPLNGATFEQIYLSNIPNRNLDLSLIDLCKKPEINKPEVKNQEPIKQIDTRSVEINENEDEKTSLPENKENMLPKTYREFLKTQKKIYKENKDGNDSVTDIFNYKRKEFNKVNNNTGLGFAKPYEVNYSPSSNVLNGEDSKLKDNRDFRFLTEKQQVQQPVYKNNWYPDNRHQENAESFLKGFGLLPKCDVDTQTSIDRSPSQQLEPVQKQEIVTKTDSEPTNRDLLKIIAQQNEQLLILQRQVALLLNREEQHQAKQIEPQAYPRPNYMGEKCITSTQNENFRNPLPEINNTPKKQRGLSKFSIDLMTSFEVAIRPQHKQNFINHEPKIQEITESESAITEAASTVDKCEKTLVDTSLHLQEPVKVREMCPSPEPSININMNDYDSSDDEEVSASEIGATFYRNLMGQVNNILRKAQVQTNAEFKDGQTSADNVRDQTMNRVKEATLRHLKNIGVTIEPIEESSQEINFANDSKDYSPTEISFAVKQLLMKYLPDEQLAKVTYKQAQNMPFDKPGKQGVISNRPEFSFATVEYMKKYNLISNNKDTKPKNVEPVPRVLNPPKPEGPKILDITALKMQPKLL